jgi:hypothetical protein
LMLPSATIALRPAAFVAIPTVNQGSVASRPNDPQDVLKLLWITC